MWNFKQIQHIFSNFLFVNRFIFCFLWYWKQINTNNCVFDLQSPQKKRQKSFKHEQNLCVTTDEQSFGFILQFSNKSFDSFILGVSLISVNGNRASNNISGGTSRFTNVDLRGDKNVRNVLIFTQQGKVEDDFKGFSISGDDDEFRDTSVEGLGGFIGTLLKSFHGGSLLDKIEELFSKILIGQRLSSRDVFLRRS